jgi:methyltransferase
MVNSRVAFSGFLLLVALLRIFELRRSAAHVRRLRARGGIEYGAGHYPWMVALHALFFASLALELWLRRPAFSPIVALFAATVFTASFALRSWSIASLGNRWTTRVLRVPGDPIVRSGPFRWFRHPNYLGVGGELLTLPLIHGCWMTSAMFSVANGILLRVRIETEEQALRETETA